MSDYLRSLFNLDGKVALITGGSSGIGFGITEALARAGAAVVLVARTQSGLDDAVAALTKVGGRAAAISADLSSRADVARVCDTAADHFGEPDILVCAAGVNPRPPLAELTTEDWDLALEVNTTAPFLLGQRFGSRMAERGYGRIINIASQQAVRAFGNSGGYGVSKAAICGLTRSQAEAWSASGVCCNAISPAFVHTPLTAAAVAIPGRSEQMAARTMIGRNSQPEDFAGMAVFLAGPASSYVTGQTLFVDGGFSVS
ncbi:SDR family NAD(P)-dependent oxidoreductase [Stackebrandtia nassauensis]|uniref:Short-chain dehydrogenase/reductase SDR n=1 Tax=Stackebrandtia nassauensis (strain DSM 44728 / CIP 108903 / NRRL B-16338 / NBRC 102104 / LLR-40K-21) TaxID=446470 RepID=D3Q699_STANL|nr:glucose 1-dehydrogenase [Stackebrandtia nassauensis]ADD42274.1 short-chain dehydrogenase/reductase SDR [Stackebrandtia nassauensis DSM 44728]